jgi:hypothetical protein
MIENVTSGHSKFPRQWLRSKAKARGQRASCTSILKVGNHGWDLFAALDCDKQPMCLLGSAGTTAMSQSLTRNYSVLLADGTSRVHQRTFEQWDIHTTDRWMDMRSAWRGAACFFAVRPITRIALPATSTMCSQGTDGAHEAKVHAWVKRKAWKAKSGAKGQVESEKVNVQALEACWAGHLRR